MRERRHDAKITPDYVPDSEYIGGMKLATSFASGQGPDIFLISPGDFLRYYNGGVLVISRPTSTRPPRPISETVIANRKVDGKIYGVPMEVEPMAFYYSVKAFEDAGLNESDVPKTWDELLEVGKKLTTADRYGLLFETQPGYYRRTSPGIPSCGRAAASSRRPTARARSMGLGDRRGAEAVAGCRGVRLGAAPGTGRWRQRHRRQPRLGLLRHPEHGHLGHFLTSPTTRPTSNTASSGSPFPRAGNM